MTTARAKFFPRIEPWLLDASITFVLAVTGVVALFVYTDPNGIEYADADALGVALVLVITLPLIVRRQHPVIVGLWTAVATLPFLAVDYAMPTAAVVLLIAVYSAASYAGLGASVLVLVVQSAVSVGYTLVNVDRHADQQAMGAGAGLTISALVILGVWGIGRAMRSRRLYTAELEDRARRLERANDVEVRAAITEERSRIARELHDVVAHHVSVMTVQAAGARRALHRDVERTAVALEAIEEIGRSALAEMRRVVGVLRTPDGDDRGAHPATLAPQPGLGDLDFLVEQVRDAGLPVDVTVDGEPRAVPVGVDLAAFRVIQEALTNTIKHAGPSAATVHVRYLPSEVHVEVSDDGHGVATALEGRRPGHGLLGMRERVALYGGTLAAGPRRGGGYEVRAKIPYDSNGAMSR
ncbi:sensor histidine kinase [Jiangella muralis]|uniref:sensor histidine kinase n=1 Tax=Jiangella muralis TaxID=702383 RepID=UPI00069E4FDF|nr:sensor histidine kinase [Jiangella muralis]